MKITHYIIIAMLIIVVLLGAGLLYFKDRAEKAQATSDRKDSIIREKNDSIRYVTNEFNRVVAEKAAAQVTTSEMMEFYSKELDRISHEFDIKAKDIKAFVVAGFQAKGEGTATLEPVHVNLEDGTTETMTDYSASDGFINFTSRILSGETTAPFSYTYTDELTLAFHVKKDHWWSKEQLYGSGSLHNPNAKITSSTNVLVDNYKDKRWGIGVAAGYGVFVHDNEVKVGPGLMVSVQYNLIKF